jgi:hypothetical protein
MFSLLKEIACLNYNRFVAIPHHEAWAKKDLGIFLKIAGI